MDTQDTRPTTKRQTSSKTAYRCSQCGKLADEHILNGNKFSICFDCLDFLEEQKDEFLRRQSRQRHSDDVPAPSAIKRFLDQYVIQQERAKRILSVAIYSHYRRLAHNVQPNNTVELAKTNVLLVGPTGSGKTLLAQSLARMLQVPFAIADATTLTEAGYVGDDVESILSKLLQAADGDVRAAQRGIIYIDEIDKISRKSENPSITRDVSGEGVQQALLKIIEGTKAQIAKNGGRKHPVQETVEIDTTNILFICGGAFDGIENIVAARIGEGADLIGFAARIDDAEDGSDTQSVIDSDDLIKYGLIPELVGRLTVCVTLDALDKEALVRILLEPKNAVVKQYQAQFAAEGTILEFTPLACEAIATLAAEKSLGARGLRTIVEDILLDVLFELPDVKPKKVIIDDKVVRKEAQPIIIQNNDPQLSQMVHI